jgi:hypothetical protein
MKPHKFARYSPSSSHQFMNKPSIIFFIFSFLLNIIFAFGQNEESHIAIFPGGEDSLKAFLLANIKYPIDARQKGIRGSAFIEFMLNSSGEVIPKSVKVIKSLSPSCDAEGIRLVKMLPRWKPAVANGVPVESRMILPLDFNLVDYPPATEDLETFVSYKIERPIKTVVKAKSQESLSPRWKVFYDSNLTSAIGSVAVGEEVEIVNWDHEVYQINTNHVSGFISHLALEKTSSMEELANIVATNSNAELLVSNLAKEKAEPLVKARAHLALTSNKESVYINECASLELAFNVDSQNRAPLQFTDLDGQITNLFPPSSLVKNCWLINPIIDTIEGVEKNNDSSKYNSYKIWKQSYCPTVIKDIQIPSIAIKMLQYKQDRRKQPDTVVFRTKPININVKPLPPGITPSAYDFFKMVGKYNLQDTISSSEMHTGEPVVYKITLSGHESATFPITPPKLKDENITIQNINIITSDKIINDKNISQRTFVYSIVFNRPGTYSFSDKVKFSYYDVEHRKTLTLGSTMKVNVLPETKTGNSNTIANMFSHLILIDVSQSMALNDYLPTRIETAVQGLNHFFSKRKTCDVGIATFTRQLRLLAPVNACYSNEDIDQIDLDTASSGTSLGNAIWLSVQSLRNTTLKTLVIISDGDNNSGSCSIELACLVARKHGIKIYTIGMGTNRLVSFNNNPNMLFRSTFSEKTLAEIATKTGGRYFFARSSNDISDILSTIFP